MNTQQKLTAMGLKIKTAQDENLEPLLDDFRNKITEVLSKFSVEEDNIHDSDYLIIVPSSNEEKREIKTTVKDFLKQYQPLLDNHVIIDHGWNWEGWEGDTKAYTIEIDPLGL